MEAPQSASLRPRPVGEDSGALALARGRWDGRALRDVRDLFVTQPGSGTVSRIVFGPDGTLGLFNPLGGQMAQIRWMPGVAELQQGNGTRAYPDLDSLVTEVTGTNVPVTSLFDWLDGRPTPVPGWEPDLSQRSEGRLIAKRLQPLPTARLQLIIESVDADATRPSCVIFRRLPSSTCSCTSPAAARTATTCCNRYSC